MDFGKSTILGVGIIVGAGVMFLFQGKDKTEAIPESTQNVAINIPAVKAVSPFQPVEVQPAQVSDALDDTSTDSTNDLMARITEAELRISELELALAEIGNNSTATEFLPAETEEPENTDLILAGFEPATVEEIETIRNDAQLQRLELRDQATREGWLNTDRFRQASRELNRSGKLREALGDDNYDKLLIAEGRNNRVRIEDVMDNSAAAAAGIESGDVILRYSDERIFSFRDLQSATTAGERDQTVTVQVIRDGDIVDLAMPRGPMGVNLIGITDSSGP